MNKQDKYKKMYPSPDGKENLVLHESGKVDIPKWLIQYLIQNSGLKSRKKRIVKKRIKRELQKLLTQFLEQ